MSVKYRYIKASRRVGMMAKTRIPFDGRKKNHKGSQAKRQKLLHFLDPA